jgi:hypothetical protein
LADFYDRLVEIALGWLGWTEEEALVADVNAILVAHAGKLDMLRIAFGGSDQPSTDPNRLPEARAGILSRRER